MWKPKPNLQTAAAARIYAGGPHHTAFSQAVGAEHLEDFAEMVEIELLPIDQQTRLAEFKSQLRFNEVYHHMTRK